MDSNQIVNNGFVVKQLELVNTHNDNWQQWELFLEYGLPDQSYAVKLTLPNNTLDQNRHTAERVMEALKSLDLGEVSDLSVDTIDDDPANIGNVTTKGSSYNIAKAARVHLVSSRKSGDKKDFIYCDFTLRPHHKSELAGLISPAREVTFIHPYTGLAFGRCIFCGERTDSKRHAIPRHLFVNNSGGNSCELCSMEASDSVHIVLTTHVFMVVPGSINCGVCLQSQFSGQHYQPKRSLLQRVRQFFS